MANADNHHPVARLALEDGSVFTGHGFGACDSMTTGGEVVFNTAMSGYQEALTDPSYAGQILVMTATQIGNYGVSEEDYESDRLQVAGFVIRELAYRHSNYRAMRDLAAWLRKDGVPGIQGIDTRALVRKLRSEGAMRGVLSTDESLCDAELIEKARAIPSMAGQNLAARVSPTETKVWEQDLGAWGSSQRVSGKSLRVLALDCGAKRNIYRHLRDCGCEVTAAPHNMSAAEIRRMNPDGILVSNGPGDPAAVEAAIATLHQVAGEFPTFGICLGHQLLALALGAKTFKLKFGHRGTNQPVRNLLTGAVEITSQNHGFCVDPASLEALDCEVTHIHLNDGTLAGFRHRSQPIFSVQYHPEASPGPHDSVYLFDCFMAVMRSRKPIDAIMMSKAQSARATIGAGGGTQPAWGSQEAR